jgi:hypothetical protein
MPLNVYSPEALVSTISCSINKLQLHIKYIFIFTAFYENTTIISVCRYYGQGFEIDYDRVLSEVPT